MRQFLVYLSFVENPPFSNPNCDPDKLSGQKGFHYTN
ncbi:hypothetical protein FLCH110379_08935 [Flavobacterium chungbukense]